MIPALLSVVAQALLPAASPLMGTLLVRHRTAATRVGAEEAGRRLFLRPVPGLTNTARLLPTAVRRGLLSFALRAGCTAPGGFLR